MTEHCVDCGEASPRTSTNYTLISRVGWRLTRSRSASGEARFEWRCPACWTAYKAALALAADLLAEQGAGSRSLV